MSKSRPHPESPKRPSQVTVPARCHPAVKIVFSEMRRQNVTYDELEARSGVLKCTFKAWRTNNNPGLESLNAALGALGWSFLPCPPIEFVDPAMRDGVIALARQHDLDEGDTLAVLINEIANRPALTGHRRSKAA